MEMRTTEADAARKMLEENKREENKIGQLYRGTVYDINPNAVRNHPHFIKSGHTRKVSDRSRQD